MKYVCQGSDWLHHLLGNLFRELINTHTNEAGTEVIALKKKSAR
jgi:hypothetical protein